MIRTALRVIGAVAVINLAAFLTTQFIAAAACGDSCIQQEFAP